MIFNYGRHYIDQQDLKAVSIAMKSNYLTGGKYVDELERKIKFKFKCKYSIACNSGTSGIYLVLKAINLKKGDNVIIPAINFVAAANICKLSGANIYFADVDKKTFQSGAEQILKCIKKNKLKSIKVIFTMHLGGSAIHQKDVFKLKKKYQFTLIEDACHALGAKYPNTNYFVGSCKYSDFAIFSLHPVKTITSGEGGLICTNKKFLYLKMLKLRSHGIQNRKNYTYDVIHSSLNFRLSDINCSLAISQLSKLQKIILKRKRIVERYQKNLIHFSDKFKIVNLDYKNNSAWHLLIIKFNFSRAKHNLKKIYNNLKKNNIVVQQHYNPTYKFKNFKNFIKSKNDFENSESYSLSCLSFPIYFSLTYKDIDEICIKLKKIFLN